jgi:PTH1 family peptidyl-tRNA hydrolase
MPVTSYLSSENATDMSSFMIAGLGNPGKEYNGTRHNIGFDIADAFVSKHAAQFRSGRLADTAEIKYKGKPVLVIKPTTYMNLSGMAVKYWLDKSKIELLNVLVLVDELALPLSKLRLRPAGSAAGHNGLKSIEQVLGTENYPRLRFGIGNDFPKGRQVEHVLGKWSEAELPIVKLKIDKSVEAIESFIHAGIERTMAEINKKEYIL